MHQASPRLSIVVGSHNARTTIAECLTELTRQCDGLDVELIVVDNSKDGTANIVREHFAAVHLIEAPEQSYIPELWAVGIRASKGAIVAITTAHCIPDTNWVRRTLEAHEQTYPGIGGAIENDGAGWTAWAIYLCRYSQYMLPFPEAVGDEIAGDNASYKRWALERYQAAWQHGFWEPTVHAEIRKDGYELWRTPAIVVYHKKSFGALSFVQNRFSHGRQFGIDRAAMLEGSTRLVHLLRSPLVPFVMLARVARAVLTKRKHVTRFFLSTPLILLFYSTWAIGEAAGYLHVARSRV